MNPIRTGAMIALTAASLFAAACKKDDTKSSSSMGMGMTAKVHCKGVNDCKGHGACKSADNACAGQNGCKGKGFMEMTEQDCKDKGGTVMAAMEK